ncbi:TauD/TfdA family dioxygenase [Sorangium sp. So ce134]
MAEPVNNRPKIERQQRRGFSGDLAALAGFVGTTGEARLPALCEPRLPGVNLASWGAARREEIEATLLRHGAILFRGFDVKGVADFDACVQAMSGGAVHYNFRASPRTQVDNRFNVYTSTDYPANERIFPHNEHSYSPVFPLQLYFYCEVPAATGGETPLGDTRALLRRIRPDVRERFVSRGIMYVRNYGDGMGLPWQTVFQTDDRAEVERYCREVGITPEWKPGDRLRTRVVGPAVVKHPQTREDVWFNHATFFHALTLPESARDRLLAEFSEQDLPQNTFYGDGSPIEPDVIRYLQDIYREVMTEFPWQAGDVVLLDNMLVLHARNSFTGPRRVLTAMARPQKSAELERPAS